MKQPCQKWQGCWCYGLVQGCGRCRLTSRGIDKIRNNAGLKTREQDEESRHSMPGNRHTKRPDKSLGRSIAPRGSSRSNCQVKAILHGGIETGAEMRGKAQRSGTEGHRGSREGTEERNGAFCCNFDLLPHK